MGQKVNPIANRLGIIRGWDSNWFGGKDFSDKLVEDAKIRKYLNVRLQKASISKIIIERTLKLVTVTISTARPGIIIGKGGQEVDKLKEELKKLTGKEIQINIFEVKRPEVDAVIVGQNIARQLEGRVSFRRAVKTAVASTCAWAPRASRSRLPDVSAAPRWPAPRRSRRDVFRCTRSVPTSTTASRRRSRRWVSSA